MLRAKRIENENLPVLKIHIPADTFASATMSTYENFHNKR